MGKRLLAFSGSRAEMGLQMPILAACREHPEFASVEVILGGVHGSDEFGATAAEVADFGFEPLCELEPPAALGSLASTAVAIGTTIQQVAQLIVDRKPDVFLVYADRYETFGAAVAATQSGVLTVHVEGGDVTEGGTLDDSLRDAISRLAHYHLATSVSSAERIVAMGEQQERVFVIGNIAWDLAREVSVARVREILSDLNFNDKTGIVVATLHPVPLNPVETAASSQAFAAGIREALELGLQVVVTYPNGDPGYQTVLATIRDLEAEGHLNLRVVKSLGSRRYQALLAASCVVPVLVFGNSSSGIKEASAFGCSSISVGTRQAGRHRDNTVISLPSDSKRIVQAVGVWKATAAAGGSLARALESEGKSVSRRAAEIIASLEVSTASLVKPAWHASALGPQWGK